MQLPPLSECRLAYMDPERLERTLAEDIAAAVSEEGADTRSRRLLDPSATTASRWSRAP